MKRILIALTIACQGCASLQKNTDLHQRADEVFREFETERKDADPRTKTSIQSRVSSKSEGTPQSFKFQETGIWIMSKAETQLYAERQAENDALAKALRATKIETYYGFSDMATQQGATGTEAVTKYLQLWSKGAVKWARVGKPEFAPVHDGTFKCTVQIKGEVVFNGEPDPDFGIILQDSGKELGLSRTIVEDGEYLDFSVIATKASYLQILSVDQEQNVYLVYPDVFSEFKKVSANAVFRYPQDNSGLGLRAALPPGRDQATEVIHVIATKNAPLFSESDYAETEVAAYKTLSAGKLNEVMAKLGALKRSDWTMAVMPYQIVK